MSFTFLHMCLYPDGMGIDGEICGLAVTWQRDFYNKHVRAHY